MTAPEDQEKTAFTCPYGIYVYRRIPFETIMEMFMEYFSVFGSSFDNCLTQVLQRCEETNLVLNWAKCHFMVREGVVLTKYLLQVWKSIGQRSWLLKSYPHRLM